MEAIQNATAGEDVSVHEKEISDAERSIRTLYEANILASYLVIENSYKTVLDKQRILEESIEFFKNDGGYAQEFIADVEANQEPLAAIVAETKTIMETMEMYRTQVVDGANGLIVVKDEEIQEEVVEETMPAKYMIDDGSIVAVTYGEVGAPYKAFLLNYNYFDVTVEYNGTDYEIGAYGYAVVTY